MGKMILFLILFAFTLSIQAEGNLKDTVKTGNSTQLNNSTADLQFDQNSKTESPFRNYEIAGNLASIFSGNPLFTANDFSFEISNGRVFLNGTVRNENEKSQIEKLASSVTGVVEITNNLRPLEVTKEEKSDETDLENDWVILENIYNQFYNSPIIESEEIKVAVYNGVVKLYGVVDSQLEKETAEKAAQKAGAKRIFNFIEVEFGPDIYEIKN